MTSNDGTMENVDIETPRLLFPLSKPAVCVCVLWMTNSIFKLSLYINQVLSYFYLPPQLIPPLFIYVQTNYLTTQIFKERD